MSFACFEDTQREFAALAAITDEFEWTFRVTSRIWNHFKADISKNRAHITYDPNYDERKLCESQWSFTVVLELKDCMTNVIAVRYMALWILVV